MSIVLIIDVIALIICTSISTNWLFMTFVFIMMFTFTFTCFCGWYGANEREKEEKRKAEEEAERQRRIARGHLEDALNHEQRGVWNCLHHHYRTDEFGAEMYIHDVKNQHEERMAAMKFWDGLCRHYIEQYWKGGRKCSAYITSFNRDSDRRDAERRKLQKEGLVDEKGNYIFWDNFPDNWKWSDEELAALDKDDNKDSANNDDYIKENSDILNAANGNETV